MTNRSKSWRIGEFLLGLLTGGVVKGRLQKQGWLRSSCIPESAPWHRWGLRQGATWGSLHSLQTRDCCPRDLRGAYSTNAQEGPSRIFRFPFCQSIISCLAHKSHVPPLSILRKLPWSRCMWDSFVLAWFWVSSPSPPLAPHPLSFTTIEGTVHYLFLCSFLCFIIFVHWYILICWSSFISQINLVDNDIWSSCCMSVFSSC